MRADRSPGGHFRSAAKVVRGDLEAERLRSLARVTLIYFSGHDRALDRPADCVSDQAFCVVVACTLCLIARRAGLLETIPAFRLRNRRGDTLH